MNREERSRKLKSNICDAARDLFITQGYKMTTIRQIMNRAAVQTGTLYHYFRDKEDILLQIVIETYEEAMQAADRLLGKDADHILRYATICALEMKAIERYEQIAELYYESHSSWRITEVMTDYNLRRNRGFFSSYVPEFTDTDYYLKTLAIRGMRFNFILERIHSGTIDFRLKCPFIIQTELELFNIPSDKISSVISSTMKSLMKDRITLRSFTL